MRPGPREGSNAFGAARAVGRPPLTWPRPTVSGNHDTTPDQEIVIPYELVSRRGDRLITDWAIEANQRRQMRNLMLNLEATDRDQAVGSIIFKLPIAGVYYAKINGRVALRPRCCIGPGGDHRVTFLERVHKKDKVETPKVQQSGSGDRMRAVSEGNAIIQRITFHRESRR